MQKSEAPSESQEGFDLDRQAVRTQISEGSKLTVAYVTMNALATIVACYGLLANSTAVVIGAMIIAMLLGPMTGLALALVDGDNGLLRRSLLAEVAGVGVVLIVALVIGLIHHNLPLTSEILARTSPNIMDLMIALAGGAAGAYATVSPRLSVGLVGVAIATALVPPLSVCSICLARGETHLAFGGFLLFFANLVAIQFASSMVIWLHGFHQLTNRRDGLKRYWLRIAASAFTLVVLAVFLTFSFIGTVEADRDKTETRKALISALSEIKGVYLSEVRYSETDHPLVIAVVRTPYSLSPNVVAKIERRLPTIGGKRPELHIRSVITKETTREGYLHQLPSKPEETDAPAEL